MSEPTAPSGATPAETPVAAPAQGQSKKTPKSQRPPRPPKKAAEKPPMTPCKILMIHGYTQSGSLFRSKVRALEKSLTKTLSLCQIEPLFYYPTGPIQLLPRDIPGWEPTSPDDAGDASIDAYGWFKFDEATGRYLGFDKGAAVLAEEMDKAGGVDVILGFSQGAFVAATLAKVLEKPYAEVPVEHREWVEKIRASNHGKDIRFSAIYCGFISKDSQFDWIYADQMQTPSVHILGGMDSVVEEKRSRDLIEKCDNAQVFVHPGSHYVPVSREWLNAISASFKKYMYDDLQPKKEVQGDSE